uniref:FMN-dependent dehydrogenase domain-containing protein n=1 Tax=Anopheles stephensi TaxID=30069 RepID=A0A182YIR3_ANOST
MDRNRFPFAAPIENIPQSDLLPLVIGPLSITNAVLQQHPSAYLTAAKVADRFRIPYLHTVRSPLSVNAFDGDEFDPTMVRWLQVFPFVDESALRALVKRAESCGFSAFVLSFIDPFDSVASIFDDHRNVYRNFESAPLDLGGLRSSNVKSLLEQKQFVPSTIQAVRSFTEKAIIAHIPITQRELIFEAMREDVDAVCVVIDEYMPFASFIDAIQAIQRSAAKKIPIYADGSSFTEEEVVRLIAHGVERVMIDQPVVWGLTIDGFEGIANVVNIYKTNLFNARCKGLFSDIFSRAGT